MKWKQRKSLLKFKNSESVVNKLLKIRGVKDNETFLHPSRDALISPYHLLNIKELTLRIIQAIYKGQKIAISNDVDVDGCTSTAMMYNYLRPFVPEENLYIIYHERSDGHGVENQLEQITDDTDLVIIIDSSSNSVKACREITERGIDVVIIDHHDVEVENPYAILVNPQQEGCGYVNKRISGAGLTYKVIQVLDDTLATDTVDDYLDLTAVGMVGDMMGLNVAENRYIVNEGINNIKNLGLQAILEVNNVDLSEVNASTIGYKISPNINGVARLERIELAIELLISDDYDKCLEIAKHMFDLNEMRKKREKELFEAYKAQVNEDDKIIIVTDTKASKGFNGLVANKLAQEYKRPAIVLREHKGTLAGSFRTYGDFDMKKFMRKSNVVQYAEGHPFSGGTSLLKRDLDKLKDYINTELEGVNFENVIEYDLEIHVDDITEKMLKQIENFDYLTGHGFPSATFKVTGIYYDSDERKIIGKNKNTLKVALDDITLMKFGVTEDYANDIPDMSRIEVVGTLNINEWTNWFGETTVTKQVFLEDYRVVGE